MHLQFSLLRQVDAVSKGVVVWCHGDHKPAAADAAGDDERVTAITIGCWQLTTCVRHDVGNCCSYILLRAIAAASSREVYVSVPSSWRSRQAVIPTLGEPISRIRNRCCFTPPACVTIFWRQNNIRQSPWHRWQDFSRSSSQLLRQWLFPSQLDAYVDWCRHCFTSENLCRQLSTSCAWLRRLQLHHVRDVVVSYQSSCGDD